MAERALYELFEDIANAVGPFGVTDDDVRASLNVVADFIREEAAAGRKISKRKRARLIKEAIEDIAATARKRAAEHAADVNAEYEALVGSEDAGRA